MMHVDHFASALAMSLDAAWNAEQDRYLIAGTTCTRAGRMCGEVVFVCHSQITDRRTGQTRSYRGLIQPDGTALESTIE